MPGRFYTIICFYLCMIGYTANGINSHIFVLEFRSQNSGEFRYYLILAKDLNYGNNHYNKILVEQISEVSKLLHAYSSAILNSNS